MQWKVVVLWVSELFVIILRLLNHVMCRNTRATQSAGRRRRRVAFLQRPRMPQRRQLRPASRWAHERGLVSLHPACAGYVILVMWSSALSIIRYSSMPDTCGAESDCMTVEHRTPQAYESTKKQATDAAGHTAGAAQSGLDSAKHAGSDAATTAQACCTCSVPRP